MRAPRLYEIKEVSVKKDGKQLVKQLRLQGFECRTTRRGHIQVRRQGQVVAVMAGTPSDRRSWRNTLADLKRVGFC